VPHRINVRARYVLPGERRTASEQLIEPHRTRAGSNLILGRLDKAGCCKQRGRGRAREQAAARADLEHLPRARYMLLGERAGPPQSSDQDLLSEHAVKPYEISRDRMRSHATAPDLLDRTGPRSTALYRYRTLPHATAPDRTEPHARTARPHRTARDRTGPGAATAPRTGRGPRTGPHGTAPDRMGPHGTRDRMGPHGTANDRKVLTLDTSLQSFEPRAILTTPSSAPRLPSLAAWPWAVGHRGR
jgi:hypothetical protein